MFDETFITDNLEWLDSLLQDKPTTSSSSSSQSAPQYSLDFTSCGAGGGGLKSPSLLPDVPFLQAPSSLCVANSPPLFPPTSSPSLLPPASLIGDETTDWMAQTSSSFPEGFSLPTAVEEVNGKSEFEQPMDAGVKRKASRESGKRYRENKKKKQMNLLNRMEKATQRNELLKKVVPDAQDEVAKLRHLIVQILLKEKEIASRT